MRNKELLKKIYYIYNIPSVKQSKKQSKKQKEKAKKQNKTKTKQIIKQEGARKNCK